MKMKTLGIALVVGIVFTLCGCRTSLSVSPPIERKPETLIKPTDTILNKEVEVEIPPNTPVKPTQATPLELKVEKETVVEVLPKQEPPQMVILPKDTAVSVSPQVELKTNSSPRVTLSEGSQLKLPSGTEIEINKVNWYAILFFILLAVYVVTWWWKVKNPSPEVYDTNKDGFIDEKEAKKIKAKKAKKRTLKR